MIAGNTDGEAGATYTASLVDTAKHAGKILLRTAKSISAVLRLRVEALPDRSL
jgi:hypothetical protein